MKVRVTVCDVCGEVGRETTPYKLQRDGEDKTQVTVDLCSRHAAPLDALLTKKGQAPTEQPVTAPAKAPVRRRRPTTIKATSLEEIEAQKKKAD
jgi:hypothetical protein